MRFQAAHKLVTYLLVLTALAALGSTGALEPLSALLFLLACGVSFVVDPGTRFARLLDRGATGARIAAGLVFAAIVWRIWRRLPDPDLGPAFDLVLALLVYRLFYRRSHRDYVHVLALSFLLVLVSSTLAHTFLFVAAFAVYVVFATWALILFHLRREMEENYLVKHSAQAPSQKVGVGRILSSRRVVGRPFFVATGVVAGAAFVGAVAIFMLVPRLGAGFVLGPPVTSGTVLGFADEIAIGRYGTAGIARRDVVLRAAVPGIAAIADDAARNHTIEELYFRGAVYDGYDHGRWVRSRRPELRTVVEEDGTRYWIRELDERGGDRHTDGVGLAGAEVQEIETVGIPGSVLFAIDPVTAIELPVARLGTTGGLRVTPRWSGEIALRLGSGGDAGDGFVTLAHARYVAYSNVALAEAAELPDPPLHARPQPRSLSAMARNAYLSVPPEMAYKMARAVTEIAAAAPAAPPADGPDDPAAASTARVAQIVTWLRARHKYTDRPASPAAGVDPVEDFVRGQAPAHCELFASSTVLLLRAAGIPARYVTGFRGGDWNRIGGYVAVRDDRAHAWAEAFVPELGWFRVDATPAGPPPPRPSRLRQITDAMDFLWSRWVVGYDLRRQMDLAQRAGRRLSPLGVAADWPRPVKLGLLALALAGLAVAGHRAWRRWGGGVRMGHGIDGGRAITRLPTGAIERLYRRTLTRLARAGWPRRASETPIEYASRLRVDVPVPVEGFDELTHRYAAARFGGKPVDDKVVDELAAKLATGLPVRGHLGSAQSAARG